MMVSRTASMTGSSDPDGSTDIYLGLGPPTRRGLNWTPTQSGIVASALFRVHGAPPPLITKTRQSNGVTMA
jgi:hypothetical protein